MTQSEVDGDPGAIKIKETNAKKSNEGNGRIGEILRTRRMEIEGDLGNVATTLRIRRHYLEAIENGKFDDLPGQAYVIGFVRSYAEYLGFDSNKVIAAFRQELEAANSHSVADWRQPSTTPSHKRAWILLFLLLGLIGAEWHFLGAAFLPPSFIETLPELLRPRKVALRLHNFSSSDSIEEASNANPPNAASDGSVGEADTENATTLDPSASDSLTPPVGDIVGSTTSLENEATPFVAGTPEEVAAMPLVPLVQSQNPPLVPFLSGITPGAQNPQQNKVVFGVPPIGAPSIVALGGDPALASGESVPEGAAIVPPTPRLAIHAKLESWIEVYDVNTKEVIVSKVLRAGETYLVPERANLYMNTGNAGGIEIEIDGRKAPELGPIGVTRRKIALDPALLASGQNLAPSTSQEVPNPNSGAATAPTTNGTEDANTGD